jgi:hypothetical protein
MSTAPNSLTHWSSTGVSSPHCHPRGGLAVLCRDHTTRHPPSDSRKVHSGGMTSGRSPTSHLEPTVLASGKRFHHEVQAAYVAGLLGVTLDNATERTMYSLVGVRQV